MKIDYLSKKDIKAEDVQALYDEAGWIAYTKEMDVLMKAIENSMEVLSAWHEDELVGLVRCVGDGQTIIYIQDILIKSNFKRNGIGRELINRLFEKYPNVRQKVLITEEGEESCSFYESVGLKRGSEFGIVPFMKF